MRSDPQFVIQTGVDVVELEGQRGKFSAVVVRDRNSGELHRYPAVAVFVFIGPQPNSSFLGKNVKRDAGGSC